MSNQFRCGQEGRRAAVLEAATLNGIDYVEVVPEDETRVEVHFLFPVSGQADPQPPPPSTLTRDNIRIEGGVRVKGIKAANVGAAGNVLTVTVNESGDFSTYTLRLVASPTSNEPPPGFDPQLSVVEFSFKVGCPSDFDCETDAACAPPSFTEPDIDYLARDYATFRRLMLDRLSVTMPDWRGRLAADTGIALVEMLAYVGDHLSYYQDAVATESYLGTARKRVSIRRHARLLDYAVHEGTNARTWMSLQVAAGSPADSQTLPAGTRLLTGVAGAAVTIAPANSDAVLRQGPVVFETMHDLPLRAENNHLAFYTWSDSQCCLPKGSTSATLRARPGEPEPDLKAGDLLLLEEVASPITGLAPDADPSRKHVVRLKSVSQGRTDPLNALPVHDVEWYEPDALPFTLTLTANVPGAGGSPETIETAVARGNIVLADHGLTRRGETLIPDTVPGTGAYRPYLSRTDLTFRVGFDEAAARQRAAVFAVAQDPHDALPIVRLDDGKQVWVPRRDLLSSDRFATDFVVETERDGRSQIRFGDDILGAAPTPGVRFFASCRVGKGKAGNLGANTITRLIWDRQGITGLRNPLPALGGTEPEPLDEVRQFAPQSFRIQQRAVTAEDYATVAQRHPEVQKAAAHLRWTGSWYTVFITIDRKSGRGVDTDDAFKQELHGFIDGFRLAGYDLEINGPVFVPLDIQLQICVEPGYFRADVKEQLFNAFGDETDALGRLGFFAPDNFTFGQTVFLSQIFQHAMSIAGVASVKALKFQRYGRPPGTELSDGYLGISALEVAQLANDPNFPENGRIDFVMSGGL